VAASDISIIGRNTQGVKIMSLDDDTLVAVKRVPVEENEKGEEA
jgi:DNA gyrase subunit A